MYNRNDPRFRRTINQISSNLESANETAQIGLFSFTENYVKPCLGAAGSCLQQTTDTCFPRHEDRLRRQRSRARGRPELSFDFYDDWEADETDALLSPQNDEFERLLGAGEEVEPSSRDPIGYGTQSAVNVSRARRKGAASGQASGRDPTVIPNQSYFGFMQKLPFRLGGRNLRYQPSAADLQERPRPPSKQDQISESLSETGETGQSAATARRHRRQRSDTTHSGQTEESLSSRGDIFPSDDEDDAVPLDDEFAITLDRRNQFNHDDSSSAKTGSSKPPSASSRSHSSRNLANLAKRQLKTANIEPDKSDVDPMEVPVRIVQDEQKVEFAATVNMPAHLDGETDAKGLDMTKEPPED